MSGSRTIPDVVRQRQVEASDPSVSAWVAANAGAGKTHVLAQRVIRLLLSCRAIGAPGRRGTRWCRASPVRSAPSATA